MPEGRPADVVDRSVAEVPVLARMEGLNAVAGQALCYIGRGCGISDGCRPAPVRVGGIEPVVMGFYPPRLDRFRGLYIRLGDGGGAADKAYSDEASNEPRKA